MKFLGYSPLRPANKFVVTELGRNSWKIYLEDDDGLLIGSDAFSNLCGEFVNLCVSAGDVFPVNSDHGTVEMDDFADEIAIGHHIR